MRASMSLSHFYHLIQCSILPTLEVVGSLFVVWPFAHLRKVLLSFYPPVTFGSQTRLSWATTLRAASISVLDFCTTNLYPEDTSSRTLRHRHCKTHTWSHAFSIKTFPKVYLVTHPAQNLKTQNKTKKHLPGFTHYCFSFCLVPLQKART